MQKVKNVLCILFNFFIFGFLVYFLNARSSGFWSVSPWGAHNFTTITIQIVVIILPLVALALSIFMGKSRIRIVMILVSIVFCLVFLHYILAWYRYLTE
ncbi:hypothetical protein [Gottfriedia solisilvae]|uniref:Uncharacterized protein n=1 Tax=Gottfriedia solisilvae TaxID=1516104 RepID=A0A8J3ADM6_9BACI|nr:hypothetical protein [Gottfriedia solisilvae]GGI11735.1 hypothetical protein GCM10007380_09330 [Gottfriedia solisilvae]